MKKILVIYLILLNEMNAIYENLNKQKKKIIDVQYMRFKVKVS